jgi:hypothetical protein
LDPILDSISRLRAEFSVVKMEIDTASKNATEALECCSQIECEVARLNNQSRQNNLVFNGLTESPSETIDQLRSKIINMFKDMKIGNPDTIKIERLYRLGRQVATRPRATLVQFCHRSDRDLIWSSKKGLKGTKVFVSEDVSPETAKYRASLIPIIKAARAANLKCTMQGDTLFLDGTKYPKGQLDKLPKRFNLMNLSVKSDDKSIAFFGKECPLSNFYSVDLIVSDIKYNCVEQYYQAQKAAKFNDREAHAKIMASSDPSTQKKLGSAISCDKVVWEKAAPEVMHCGLLAKFTQNLELKNYLLGTNLKEIYEASPKDSFWGTGMALNNAKALQRNAHSGKNWLGKILESVREQIRNDLTPGDLVPPSYSTK